MKMILGARRRAMSNKQRTILSDSPRYLDATVAEDTLKNETFASVATALANIVFPVPGGPNISTPFTNPHQTTPFLYWTDFDGASDAGKELWNDKWQHRCLLQDSLCFYKTSNVIPIYPWTAVKHVSFERLDEICIRPVILLTAGNCSIFRIRPWSTCIDLEG